MAQNVIEFASERADAIVKVLIEIVQPIISIRILTCIEQASLTYQPTIEKLHQLLSRLNDGSVCSVIAYSSGDFRYGLVTCPGFNGQQLSLWMGTIELVSDEWQPIWIGLLKVPELKVVCVSQEEGLELRDGILSEATFPWTDPAVLAAGVRREDGSWNTGNPIT